MNVSLVEVQRRLGSRATGAFGTSCRSFSLQYGGRSWIGPPAACGAAARSAAHAIHAVTSVRRGDMIVPPEKSHILEIEHLVRLQANLRRLPAPRQLQLPAEP